MEIYCEKLLINTLQNQSVKEIVIRYTTQSLPLLDEAKHLQYLYVYNNELKAIP